MSKNAKKILFLALALVIIASIGLLFVLNAAKNKEFDSAAWKNKELVHGEEPIRKKMIGSLLRNDRLIGMSRTEIDDLLGPSTRTNYDFDCDRTYWLGPESGFGVDSVWLCINFSERGGRVVAAKLVTD